jgi:hypothetical protein
MRELKRVKPPDIEGHLKSGIERIELPPNAALQLTCQPVTPFAKRRAKGAPACHAAELGC